MLSFPAQLSQGWLKRKSNTPVGEKIVMLLLVLSSETEKLFVVQFVVLRFVFCHNVQPAEGDGHNTLTAVGLTV